MSDKIPELKYYNLCLPKEILDNAKSIAARRGETLKQYIARAIVEANKNEIEKGGEFYGEGHTCRSKI